MLTKDQTYEDNFEDNTVNQHNEAYPNASIGVINSRSIITLDGLSSYDVSFDSLKRNNRKKTDLENICGIFVHN